ncbi:MAG: TA system VapC family ribonuclease toxin [Chthoniobacterales bacterium]
MRFNQRFSSLDTNILLYAANEDAPEHGVCKAFLEQIVRDPTDWIIADQVYLELYRALRNPKVMSHPLSPKQAAGHVSVMRDEMGMMHCGYVSECWGALIRKLETGDFPFRRTHDAVLAATLISHGVKTFYTRNTKDFMDAGFMEIINPVDRD